MEMRGFEPLASSMRPRRSSQLSYIPLWGQLNNSVGLATFRRPCIDGIRHMVDIEHRDLGSLLTLHPADPSGHHGVGHEEHIDDEVLDYKRTTEDNRKDK